MNTHPAPNVPTCESPTCQPSDRRCSTLHESAVALWQSAAPRGATCDEMSRRLTVSARTLRRWRQGIHTLSPAERAVGRPRFVLDHELRQAIRRDITELGVRTGVATFQERFPHVPRRVLADVKNHYRQVLLRWRRRQLARLEWTEPGRVWAMDHAQPPLTVDGKHPHILSVRDLASGVQLAWESIRSADADTTVAVLTRLFVLYGAPLAMKSDNGKALTQGGVPALLAQQQVTALVSPPYRPQYNGSCEAGVKAMKTRTEDLACLADRSGRWTSEDLAHALQIANEHHRAGPHSPSRSERWQERTPITPDERALFLSTLAQNRAALAALHPNPITKSQTKTLERQSVAQTLVELGHLIIHRRPNTSPIKEQTAARIS